MKKWYSSLLMLLPLGCVGIPEGLKPVENFEVNKYLGTWYELVRLDHRFERGLSQVSATYTVGPNETIVVLNRGFDQANGQWKTIQGKAKLAGDNNEGRLKVSFFGPFYAAYNILYLDSEYQHAIVCGPNRSYLWILSREKTISEAKLDELVQKAQEFGFETEKLIYVDHANDKFG
jgi:apolipoprotein D and lipocalin family protein